MSTSFVKKWGALLALSLIAFGLAGPFPAYAIPAPTQMVLGNMCPPGSPVRQAWEVVEDRNGDGNYDFSTQMDWRGTLRWGPIGGNFTSKNLSLGETVTATFAKTEGADGYQSWIVTLKSASTGKAVRDVSSKVIHGL